MKMKKPKRWDTLLNWLDNLARLWRIGKWLYDLWLQLK